MAVEWKKMLIDGDQVDNFIDLDDVPANYAAKAGYTVKVNVGESALEFVDVSGDTDEKVGVSVDDTAPGYLEDKIVGGTGITTTTLTPAGDEDVEIKITDGGVDTVQLAADAVTGAKIADDAVGSEHIETLDAALDFGGQQAQDMVFHTVADNDAKALLTPVVGKVIWQTDTAHPYICISSA